MSDNASRDQNFVTTLLAVSNADGTSPIKVYADAVTHRLLVSVTGDAGTVTSVDVSGGTTGLTNSGGPITTSGVITLAGTLAVANGGTGATSSTGSGSVVLSTSPTFTTPILGSATTTGLSTAIVTKTGTYTATTADFTILCDATTGSFSVNLPAAASNSGRIYNVKKIDSSANTVTIDPNASETIDGASTKVINTQYVNIQFQCNGTAWYTL